LKPPARLLLILLLVSSPAAVRGGVRYSLAPSVFYTYGDYSDSRYSHDIAGYTTIGIQDRHSLSLAYDNIVINHNEFAFRQQMGLAGVLLSKKPWAAKLDYGRIVGKFRLKAFDLRLRDETNIYSAEFLCWSHFITAGASYSSIQATLMIPETTPLPGPASQAVPRSTQQYLLRLEVVPHWRLRLIALPAYSWVQDGRRLYSTVFRANFVPAPRLLLKAGGMVGQRAYYFDNELFTIYNQNETQSEWVFGQAEYDLWHHVIVVAEFIHTHFQNYDINYSVLGLKTRFGL
jgi:hypothetical protein